MDTHKITMAGICLVHPGQTLVMYCLPCQKSVCETCVEERGCHGRHRLCTIETAAQGIVNKHVKLASTMCVTQLETEMKKFSIAQNIELNAAEETRQTILDLKTKHDQHTDSVFENLKSAERKGKEQIRKVQEYQNSVAELQKLENPLEVIERGRNLEIPEVVPNDMPDISRQVFYGHLQQQHMLSYRKFDENEPSCCQEFQSCPSSISNADRLFDARSEDFEDFDERLSDRASIPESDFDENEILIDSTENVPAHTSWSLKCDAMVTQKHSFKIDPSAILMRPTHDGCCWIRCINDTKTIKHINTSGEVQTIVPFHTTVVDFLVLPGLPNQFLVSCYHEKCIKKITKNGEIFSRSIVIITAPLQPQFLCWNPYSGCLLVTLTRKTFWSIEPEIPSFLVKYNQNFEELHRVHVDGHGNRLFYVPHKMCTSNTGTVAVINITSSSAGHLVLLDDNLNVKLRLINQRKVIPADTPISCLSEKFMVMDVLFTLDDLLIIAEAYTRTVQLLDQECRLLKVLLTDLQSPPRALALHRNRDLVVALRNGTVDVYKYKWEFRQDNTTQGK